MAVDIQTSISVTRMIDKNSNPIKDSILHSIRSKQDIESNMLIDMNNSFSGNVNEYFRYGVKFFEEGLPGSLITEPINGNSNVANTQLPTIETIIEAQVGEPVQITRAFLTRVDYKFLAFEWLDNQPKSFWDNLGLDPIYKLAPNRFPRYTFEYDSTNGHLLIHIGLFSTLIGFNLGITGTDQTVITDIPFILPTETFYHIVYIIKSDFTNRIHYWNYQISTHVYPVLDLAANTAILSNLYLPIAPVRKDKINVVDMGDSKIGLKNSTEKLLKKIGIDLNDLTNNMVDSSNPSNLNDVDEAFVMFAADITSTDQTIIKYMYEALREIKPHSIFNQQQVNDNIVNEFTNSGIHNSIFLASDSFRMSIAYDFITLQIKNGLNTLPKPSIDPYLPVPEVAGIDANNVGTGNVTVELNVSNNSIIYRKQLTTIAAGDPSDTYSELIVVNLETVHHVLTDIQYHKDVTRNLSNMSDGGFVFPIDYDLITKFNKLDQTKIYEDSLIFVAYAFHITHLSFFQSGLFKILVLVVLVVISIITNTEGFIGVITFESAALEALAVNLLVTFALTQVFMQIVKVIGGKFALVLAAITAIIAFNPTTFKSIMKLISAENLLVGATAMITAVQKVTASQFLKLQQTTEDFFKSLKDKQEELDAANNLLDSRKNFAMYELTNEAMFSGFNEKPPEFFKRTIHDTNPGVLSLSMIEYYVDVNLTLPKVGETNL